MIGKLLLPLLLQLIAVVVIIAEFIIPSMGILSIIAAGLFGWSLYLIFTTLPVNVGITVALVDLALVPVLVIVGVKMLAASRITLRDTLARKDGAVSQPPEWNQVEGKEGTTITALHPAGSVMIDGKKYDVVSRGDYIERNVPVVVIAVEGNRIVVKKKGGS
jgi:membrane-bound ClpP family serine protease